MSLLNIFRKSKPVVVVGESKKEVQSTISKCKRGVKNGKTVIVNGTPTENHRSAILEAIEGRKIFSFQLRENKNCVFVAIH